MFLSSIQVFFTGIKRYGFIAPAEALCIFSILTGGHAGDALELAPEIVGIGESCFHSDFADELGSGAQKNDSFSDFELELILQGSGSCCFVKILHKSGFGHTCDGAEFCDRNFLIVVNI